MNNMYLIYFTAKAEMPAYNKRFVAGGGGTWWIESLWWKPDASPSQTTL
jgi:hypothetical protein